MRKLIDIGNIRNILLETPFSQFNVEECHEGISTNVYKLTDNNQIAYLRICPKYLPSEVEAYAHNLMLQQGVKVPEILYIGKEETSLNDLTFLITSEVKGKSINNSSLLSETEKREVLLEAGKDIAKINKIQTKDFGYISFIKGKKLKGYAHSYLEIINDALIKLKEIETSNELTKDTISKLYEYIEKNKSIMMKDKKSFLAHGDVSLNHIYQNNGKYTGIIDFGNIKGANILHDLAYIYTFENDSFQDILDGYKTVTNLPKNYMKRIHIEAMIFGVRKYWWKLKNTPEKIKKRENINKIFNKILQDQ